MAKIIIYEGVRQSGCTTLALKTYNEYESQNKNVILITRNKEYRVKNNIIISELSFIDIISLPYDVIIFDKCYLEKPKYMQNVEYHYLNHDAVINRFNGNAEKINKYIDSCIEWNKTTILD